MLSGKTDSTVRTGVFGRFLSLSTMFRTGLLWIHMPGFIAWMAVTLGIVLPGALRIPQWTLVHSAAPPTLIVSALFLIVAGILTRMIAIRFTAFFLSAFLITAAGQSHQRTVFQTFDEVCRNDPLLTLSGKVVSPPMPWFEGFHFLFRIESAAGDQEKTLQGLTLNATLPFEPPQYGTITLTGRFSLPRIRKNPYEYDEYNTMMAKGIWGTIEGQSGESLATHLSLLEKLSLTFRKNADATIRKISDYDLRALLQACFLGDKEFLSPTLKERFRIAGTYHLIAISGLHTAILTGALYFLLRLLPLGRVAPNLICITALWLYLLFIGMIPSLFRATVMATLVIVSLLFERKNYPMHTIGLAGTVWLLLSPESLATPGYQLSFAATAALLTLFPVAFRYCPRIKNRVLGPIVTFIFSSLSISLISFLATAPVLLYHFGTLSFFGIIANLIAVTAMTAGMWAFFAGLLLEMILPFITFIPLWISERFLDIVVGIGHTAARFPWSQAAFPAPHPEIIAAFVLFLIGIASIRSERLGRYLLFSLVAATGFIITDLSIRRYSGTAHLVRFEMPRSAFAGIKWPDNSLWLFSPSLSRCSTRDIERHLLPWLRHVGNGKANAVIVPEDQVEKFSELASPVKAFSSATVLTIPAEVRAPASRGDDPEGPAAATILASWTPCPGCTCSVISRKKIFGIRIAASGADTVVFFPHAAVGKGRKRTNVGRAEATIFSLKKGKVTVSTVSPVTHPLGYAIDED
jgi:ComEC/Rec2-related protein